MLAFSSALLSWLAGRFRGCVELELEVIALRHQLAVLRRQRPGRTWLSAFDRLLRVWLYRAWPQCLNAAEERDKMAALPGKLRILGRHRLAAFGPRLHRSLEGRTSRADSTAG